MTEVDGWVCNMWEEVVGADGSVHLEIGMTTRHPKTGEMVRIVDGQYWGQYGLSNFWYWRNVNPDGSLGKLQHGYGWRVASPPPKGIAK